ncbi:MAG: SLC13 family permease [Brevibacterium yomogidense]
MTTTAPEALSHTIPAVQESGRTRSQNIGLITGPALAGIVLIAAPASLSGDGRAVAATALLMAVWWMTEALPLPATSLLPLVVFPTVGVAEIGDTAAPYAGSVIFLILGGVLLGLATQRWNLHKRIALLTVLAVGTKPDRIILGMMLASAFISMWVSNTATAVIMVPIAVSILTQIREGNPGTSTVKLTAAMLLGVAYSVTIGSMATLIGQPTMPMMRGYLEEAHGVELGFAEWMLIGVPFGIIMLFVAWVILTKVVFRSEVDVIPGGRDVILTQFRELGRVSTEERKIIGVFGGAIFCWLVVPFLADAAVIAEALPWIVNIDDTSVAIAAALLVLTLPASRQNRGPLLPWSSTKEVPWGVLLLIGSGMALSTQFTASGLSEWIGGSVSQLGGASPVILLVVAVVVLLALTELTSNVATAAAFLPVMGAVAVGAGMDPLLMTVAVTMAVSSAYMLPVATPSNSVAFASGEFSIRSMVKAGVWLNIISVCLVFGMLYTLVPLVLGVGL